MEVAQNVKPQQNEWINTKFNINMAKRTMFMLNFVLVHSFYCGFTFCTSFKGLIIALMVGQLTDN